MGRGPHRDTSTDNSQFVTMKFVSQKTGFGYGLIRGLVASGELPGYRLSNKPGAGIRVKLEDVERLMRPVVPPQPATRASGRNTACSAGTATNAPAGFDAKRRSERRPYGGEPPQRD